MYVLRMYYFEGLCLRVYPLFCLLRRTISALDQIGLTTHERETCCWPAFRRLFYSNSPLERRSLNPTPINPPPPPPIPRRPIQSFGLAKLDEIQPGLAAEAVAAGREVEQLHLTRPSGETIARVDMTRVAKVVGYPFIGITRYALQSVLLRRLEDDDLELGARLQGLETHEAEGITELRFEGHADAVRARAVLGADGRRYDAISAIARIPPRKYPVAKWLQLHSASLCFLAY